MFSRIVWNKIFPPNSIWLNKFCTKPASQKKAAPATAKATPKPEPQTVAAAAPSASDDPDSGGMLSDPSHTIRKNNKVRDFYKAMAPYRRRVAGDEEFEELYQKRNIMPYGRIKLDWWNESLGFHKWPKWQVRTDVDRRKLIKEFAPWFLRMKVIKGNRILPTAIRNEADEKMRKMPKYTFFNTSVRDMCQVTGRKRGRVRRYRVSRFIFREYADKGKLSGVMRAIW